MSEQKLENFKIFDLYDISEVEVKDFGLTNSDPASNGGTKFSIVALNAKEVGSAGELYGYLYVQKLGTTSITTTIDIDGIFNVPDSR